MPFHLIMVSIALAAPPELSEELRCEAALLTLIEQAEISSTEPGLLNSLLIKEGELVGEGKPIASLDERDAKLMFDRAETELTVAKSIATNDIKVRFARQSATVADAEYARALESNAQLPKSVSQTELDRLKLVAAKATLEIEQAEIEFHQAKLSMRIKELEFDRSRLALERRTITAPFPGMVVNWRKHRGEWVEPGVPIMRIIRLDRMRVETFVPSHKLSNVTAGRPVSFIPAQIEKPGGSRSGKLVFVSPEIDPVNRQVRVWAEVDNSDLVLRPGQPGTLIIGGGNR